MLDRYARAGYCVVITGSTQQGRALREPDDVPEGDRLLPRARAPRRRRLYRVSPTGDGRSVGPFSFDFSFNSYPLDYERPGPEIVDPPDLLSGLLTAQSIFSEEP